MSEEDLQKEWRQFMIVQLSKLEDYQSKTTEALSKFSNVHTELLEIKTSIKELQEAHRKFMREDEIKKDYITRTEFEPIKRVVYGAIGTVLLGILGAIVSLVLRK